MWLRSRASGPQTALPSAAPPGPGTATPVSSRLGGASPRAIPPDPFELRALEEERVHGDEEGAAGHADRGDLRPEDEPQRRVEEAHRDREGDRGVGDRPEEVLAHLADRGPAKRDG